MIYDWLTSPSDIYQNQSFKRIQILSTSINLIKYVINWINLKQNTRFDVSFKKIHAYNTSISIQISKYIHIYIHGI
jgi:hypothetical protein